MIPCQRHLFDIPDDVAYLNCAYMSPLMKPALEAGTAGLARKAHPWELTPDKFFTGSDEFRATAAPRFTFRSSTPTMISMLCSRNRSMRRGLSVE